MTAIASAPDFVGAVLQSSATKPPSDDFFLLKVRRIARESPSVVLYASEACMFNKLCLAPAFRIVCSLGVGGE